MAFLPDGSAWIHYSEPQGLQRIRVDGTQVTVLERREAGQGLRSDRIYAVAVPSYRHEGQLKVQVRLRVASLAKSKLELEELVTERAEGLRSRNADLTVALGRVKQLSGRQKTKAKGNP